jgi:hypothetical protein
VRPKRAPYPFTKQADDKAGSDALHLLCFANPLMKVFVTVSENSTCIEPSSIAFTACIRKVARSSLSLD